MTKLTHSRVIVLFDYDSSTGNLIWKVSESNRIKVGDSAGAVARNGRRYIGVDGERQIAHRLVWFHQKGVWPSENLAPLNGDYLDTRIENLIEQTAQETVNKGKLRSTNKSGVKGVWFDKTKQKWAVQTVQNYRTTFHGYYETVEEAAAARESIKTEDLPYLSPEERARMRDAKRANVYQRRLWDKMLRDNGGVHSWESIFTFIEDVGAPPKKNFFIAPSNSTKPVGPDNFVWSPPQYDNSIRDERMIANRSYRYDDYNKYRDKELRRNFGIDGLKEYEEKLNDQNGVCAICGQPETTVRDGRTLPLFVDHNHDTGAVRGLLCNGCNTGLGKLKDSANILQSAIKYLTKWQCIETSTTPNNVIEFNGVLGNST